MSSLQAKTQAATRMVRHTKQVLQEEIWHHDMVADNSPRGKLYAFLRVMSITVRGAMTKKMFSQAAALSYASLMSLGPIVSLAIMLSTFVLQNHSKEFTTNLLHEVATFIVPSAVIAQNETATAQPAPADNSAPTDNSAPADPSAPATTKSATGPQVFQLDDLINAFVTSANTRSVGIFGLPILVFLCIQMMVTIENNFNNIWGVRRGRDILKRIVLYWTVFSLGVLAAFTTAAVLTAATFGTVAGKSKLAAWKLDFVSSFTGVAHVLAFVMLTLLLAAFYRFIPNTKVRWRPALLGGMVVATCLILNNLLSFLYVSVVLSKMSFYSTVSIVPILMFGLYVFWLMVLFGGVLTYAVQNANNITADRLWNQVSPRTRRLLNLAAFLQISRAFLRGKPGLTSEEIAQILRVPAALINEGLGRLTDLHILSAVEITTKDGEHEVRYQPGRPLHKLTLGKFHLALDMLGNTEGDDTLQATDPLLQQYLQSLAQFETGPLLQKTFAELLSDEKSGVTNFPYRL
jgi:membrane protein